MDLIMVLLNIMIFDDREMFRERNIDDKTMLHLFPGEIRTLILIFTLLLKLTQDQRNQRNRPLGSGKHFGAV